MRIVVTGASGLIGSAVVARLASVGHEVTAVVRTLDHAARRLPARRLVRLDVARTAEADWLPHLAEAEAVVNCTGVLQDSPRDSTHDVHVRGAAALFGAAERQGVRRIVHISALGVDRDGETAFARTKLAGDADLMARDLDWVILRPAIVVGRQAYGGSAILRGLAALPVLPLLPDIDALQIVQLDDVAETVSRFLRPAAPARLALDLAPAECLTFAEGVGLYRRWLGWPPARVVTLPRPLASALYKAGDLAALLGWRPPVRSTARAELARGMDGDPERWREVSGIAPLSLVDALAREPAGVQERWFAALYLLKPAVFAALALFWLITGLVTLGPGYETGLGLMLAAGLGPLAAPSVIAGALADVAIGLGIIWRRTARAALYAALALSLVYGLAGTVLLPQLWADPLGPLLKILPLLALNALALAILDDR